MTEESIFEAIKEMIQEKKDRGIAPGDQVTLLEMMMRFKGEGLELRKILNALFKKKKIKVGPTMNGTYIKIRE